MVQVDAEEGDDWPERFNLRRWARKELQGELATRWGDSPAPGELVCLTVWMRWTSLTGPSTCSAQPQEYRALFRLRLTHDPNHELRIILKEGPTKYPGFTHGLAAGNQGGTFNPFQRIKVILRRHRTWQSLTRWIPTQDWEATALSVTHPTLMVVVEVDAGGTICDRLVQPIPPENMILKLGESFLILDFGLRLTCSQLCIQHAP